VSSESHYWVAQGVKPLTWSYADEKNQKKYRKLADGYASVWSPVVRN
jgi:hypothetical protein